MPNALPGWPRGLPQPLAAAYVGLSEATLRRQVEAGEAPRPVQLSRNRQVWLRDQLDAYLDRKAGITPTPTLASAWSD